MKFEILKTAIVFSFKCLLIHSSIERCPILPHVLFTTKISSSSWLTVTRPRHKLIFSYSIRWNNCSNIPWQYNMWTLVFQIKYCVYTTTYVNTSSLKFFYNVSSQINFLLKLKHLSIILFLYLYQHFRVRKLQVYWPLFYITTKTFFLKDQFYYKLMTAHKIQLQNAPHMWNEKWKWWVSNG